MEAWLAQYPTTKDLCLKILQETMDFWNSYVPMLTAFYKKLLAKVCGGKTCSTALIQACWDMSTSTLKVMLDEVHKVRVHASSAHLMQGPRGLGWFLHATLQEWVLKDFREEMIENHHPVPEAMVTHLFNTCITKSEIDLSKLNTSSLEIKCNELESTVKLQKKLIDNNANTL